MGYEHTLTHTNTHRPFQIMYAWHGMHANTHICLTFYDTVTSFFGQGCDWVFRHFFDTFTDPNMKTDVDVYAGSWDCIPFSGAQLQPPSGTNSCHVVHVSLFYTLQKHPKVGQFIEPLFIREKLSDFFNTTLLQVGLQSCPSTGGNQHNQYFGFEWHWKYVLWSSEC